MAVQEALVVPVAVEAMVVNDAVRREQPFMRWGLDYEQLQLYATPEPQPFEAPTDFGSDSKNDGIYLRWELPDALRRAEAGPGGGGAEFPAVPNRWLVVRSSGPEGARQATGWVVESDFLGPSATSPFFAAVGGGAPEPTRIGRKLEIGSDGWSESAAPRLPHPTAVAPGLPSFAAYQPYNQDVFSIHDPLDGVAAADTLSYLVVGWYADPGQDPLAKGEFGQRMVELGWTVAGGDSADRSIYSGSVDGVEWNAAGATPASVMPKGDDVALAFGPTAVDALTALVTKQSDGHVDAERLAAFQHGIIDELGEPDGPEELARRAHDAAFSLLPGGFAWEIGDAAGETSSLSASDLEAEEEWLAELNASQAACDEAARDLGDLQRRLYETWWLVGRARRLRKAPTGVDVEALAKELDPANADGLAHATATQAEALEKLKEAIPSGATEEELGKAIETFAQGHSIPASRQLKRVGRQPFARANDPVLLLAGIESETLLGSEQSLPCRFPDRPGTEDSIPALNLANVPAVVAELAAELFALPASGSQEWAQPWSPLYLLWELDYYPIDFEAATSTAPWSFDGSAYSWAGAGGYAGEPLGFAGRTLLTPQAVFNLRAQIARYEESHPDADLEAVAAFIAETDRWDLLSQALDGLGTMLALRDPRARPVPPESLAALIEGNELGAPEPGIAQAQFGKWGPSLFQQLRAGQVAFSRVAVVDRFGQVLNLIDAENSLDAAPALAPELEPQHPVLAQSPQRFAQLPPRLPQAARVELELDPASADPICGWLLPNHLDRSLLAFDPGGAPLGELRVVSDSEGHSQPNWSASPGSPYEEAAAMEKDFPQLASFVEHFTAEPNAARAADLKALQSAVDETLATIEPLGGATDGSLALLVGRPLCLVRARARLELDGPPLADPSWRYAMEKEPPTPAFASYELPVRLGEEGRLGDGLVGYFRESEYAGFNVVRQGALDSPYIAPIGQDNYLPLAAGASQPTYLTLLLDPRAPVHAVSDVLPVATLELPPAMLRGPLGALAPSFRVGPVLSTARRSEAGVEAVVMPSPALHAGTWSWAEKAGGAWAFTPLQNADQMARLPQVPVARNGMLKLSGAEGSGE